MLGQQPKAPGPRGGLKYIVSLLLLLVSAAYGYWQNFSRDPEAGIRRTARAQPHVYPMPLANAQSAALAPQAAAVPTVPAVPILPNAPAVPAQPAAPDIATPPPTPGDEARLDAPPAAPQIPPLAPPMEPPAPVVPAFPAQHRQYAFADGDYTGAEADSEWGIVQVKVFVRNGVIQDVQFLQIPDHRRRSAEISDWAGPLLIEEAIKEQNYDVDVVSSATVTSLAFQQTLFDALRQAKR